jgi:hypothetical protein
MSHNHENQLHHQSQPRLKNLIACSIKSPAKHHAIRPIPVTLRASPTVPAAEVLEPLIHFRHGRNRIDRMTAKMITYKTHVSAGVGTSLTGSTSHTVIPDQFVYHVWPGLSCLPGDKPGTANHDDHEFHEWPTQSEIESGQPTLDPVIYSYWGFRLPYSHVTSIKPLYKTRTRKLMLLEVALCVAPVGDLVVHALQGDNDLLRLLEPLPNEDNLFGIEATEFIPKQKQFADNQITERDRFEISASLHGMARAALDSHLPTVFE